MIPSEMHLISVVDKNMKFNLLYVNHISITTRDNLIISCVCKVLLCRAYGSLCSLAIILYHIVKFPCLHCVRHRGGSVHTGQCQPLLPS